MAVELVFVALAFGLALGLLKLRPEGTKRWFRRIMTFRQVIGGVFLLVFSLFLIGTGVSVLVLAGFIMLVYAALYLLLERPHATIVSTVKSTLGR